MKIDKKFAEAGVQLETLSNYTELIHLEMCIRDSNWPWLAVLVALPTLALVVLVLMLFGQQPDSMIKAWTNTACLLYTSRCV